MPWRYVESLASAAAPWSLRAGLRSLGFQLSGEPGDAAIAEDPEPPDAAPNDETPARERVAITGDLQATPTDPTMEYLPPAASLILSLSEALQVGMLSVDANERIVFVNQKLCQTFGLSAESGGLMRTPASLLYYSIARLSSDPTRTAQALLDAARSLDLPARVEFDLTDGRQFGGVCASVADDAEHRFWLFRPRSASAHASEPAPKSFETIDLHQRKSAMLTTTSHEVRGTIHGILGLVDELRDSSAPATDPELLDLLTDACEGLRVLVQQVLDVAQLDTAATIVSRDTFDLREILNQVSAVVTGVLRSKATQFSLSIDPRCHPWRVGDAGRVSQILTNVATNAAKSSEHGRVSIEVSSPEPDSVRFVVTDDGPGMPDFAQKRLTTPHERNIGSAGNAGLGLLIAREIIELLQGDVTVSVAAGAGTTVDIVLPLQVAQAEPLRRNDDGVVSGFHRALLVDDAPEGLEFLSRSLRDSVDQIDITSDTTQAIRLANERSYDLVVLVGMMAPHDGADLARALRMLTTTATSAIVVATANASKVSATRYLSAGADLVLVKPFSKRQLLSSLRTLLPNATATTLIDANDRPSLTVDAEGVTTIDIRQSNDESANVVVRRRRNDWLSPRPDSIVEETEDRQLQRQALQMFVGALDRRIGAIGDAFSADDTDAIALATHALGSPALVVGATRTGRYALALETVARSIGLEGITSKDLDELETLARKEIGELLALTSPQTSQPATS